MRDEGGRIFQPHFNCPYKSHYKYGKLVYCRAY